MNIKMSINNYFKKTFFKNQLYFGLFKTAITKSVKTASNLNNSNTPKEQLKTE